MTDNKKLWDSVLVDIELNVSRASFKTWLKDTSITNQQGGTVWISVPNPFVKDWLVNKYHKHILKSLRNYGEKVRAIEYVISKEGTKKDDAKGKPSAVSMTYELPLNDYYVNREDNLNPRYDFDN